MCIEDIGWDLRIVEDLAIYQLVVWFSIFRKRRVVWIEFPGTGVSSTRIPRCHQPQQIHNNSVLRRCVGGWPPEH